MTHTQLIMALSKLNITSGYFASLMGVGPRTTRYWLAGKVSIHPSSELLTHLLLKKKLTLNDIETAWSQLRPDTLASERRATTKQAA